MNKRKPIAAIPPNLVTMIGSKTSLRGGLLKVEQDLRIDGHLEADVDAAGRVVVSPEASLQGRIRARELVVAGRLSGEVVVEDCLTVRASAVVEGSVLAARLVVEDGAKGSARFMIGSPDDEHVDWSHRVWDPETVFNPPVPARLFKPEEEAALIKAVEAAAEGLPEIEVTAPQGDGGPARRAGRPASWGTLTAPPASSENPSGKGDGASSLDRFW